MLSTKLSQIFGIWVYKDFFPKAKIIHDSRNPKDNCLSIYENVFDFPEGWRCDQEELAGYYLIYKDIMKFWNNLFDNEIHNIRYEDIVMNPTTKIKDLIRYCD